MQCKAMSKQSGERCKRHAARGKEVCAMHGGKSLSGLASKNLKHGKYSKALPARLVSIYQNAEALNRQAGLNVIDDINLIDTRLADLLTRVESGESGQAWKEARTALKSLRENLADGGDMNKALRSIRELDRIIRRGLGDYAAWEEVRRLVDQRARLIGMQQKADIEQGKVIAQADVQLLTGFLLRIVLDNVTDRRALENINNAFQGIQVVEGMLVIPGPE